MHIYILLLYMLNIVLYYMLHFESRQYRTYYNRSKVYVIIPIYVHCTYMRSMAANILSLKYLV